MTLTWVLKIVSPLETHTQEFEAANFDEAFLKFAEEGAECNIDPKVVTSMSIYRKDKTLEIK